MSLKQPDNVDLLAAADVLRDVAQTDRSRARVLAAGGTVVAEQHRSTPGLASAARIRGNALERVAEWLQETAWR
jgi:hypothetical protein